MKKICSAILVLALLIGLAGCGNSSEKQAFNESVSALEARNEELSDAIDQAKEVLTSGMIPYDETVLTELQVAISEAELAIIEAPEMPKDADAIVAETETVNAVEYSEQLIRLQEAQQAYEISVMQMEQMTNPTGDFVIQRISEIENISEILGATEENDPNESLNKQGGYTSATFFTSPLVKDRAYGNDAIERGTDGGGCIEVYDTIEGAQNRDTYLAAFDGSGALNPGSHVVCGTVVIRTSKYLTATQQQELTNQIEAKLIEIR